MLKTRDKALISLTALFQAAPGIRRGTVPVLHTVYGKKNTLERAPGQFLPCVLLLPKNFQKFCAVSTLIFFLSTTYL